MRCTLPNLDDTIARWNKPSILLILGLALAYFGPPLWDRHFRERPWITAELRIDPAPDFAPLLLIRDTVVAGHNVAGERLTWMENAAGYRICGSHREDSWLGRSVRTWSVPAFFDNVCGEPTVPWRACTKFLVETDYGNRGAFGPYCSDLFDPGRAS